jgi:hypothetical protein
MAREYARVKVTIWADLDFRGITPTAQHLYFLLLTSPTLNMAGVADWRPARLAKMAKGWTAARVRKAADELEEHGFIVADDDSEEVIVRSFVRHDGVLKSPNLTTAMVKDYAGIGSPRIMATLVAEVQRAAEEHPDWKGLKEASTILSEPISKGSETVLRRVPDRFEEISPIPHPSSLNQQPPDSVPENPERAHSGKRFDDFWKLYPRREGKAAAAKAWAKATKTAKADDILTGLRAQLPHLAMQRRTDGDFRPHPSTWLNQGRWADEIDGATDGQPAHSERPSIALWPKCPECRAPQEIVHYDACGNQEWTPDVS